MQFARAHRCALDYIAYDYECENNTPTVLNGYALHAEAARRSERHGSARHEGSVVLCCAVREGAAAMRGDAMRGGALLLVA